MSDKKERWIGARLHLRLSAAALVLCQIREATRLAEAAERAYHSGDLRAGGLHVAAAVAHCDLLRAICRLSDEEADAIEPPFTDLEQRLLRLSSLSSRAAPC